MVVRFSLICHREAKERRGTASGNESLLREERNCAGSEAGAQKQRPLTGFSVNCSGRTSQVITKMRQFVYLPYAADVTVAVTDSFNIALLLGFVSRTGQT